MNPDELPANKPADATPEKPFDLNTQKLEDIGLGLSNRELLCKDSFDIDINNFTVGGAIPLDPNIVMVTGLEKIAFFERQDTFDWKLKNTLMEEAGPYLCKSLEGLEFLTADQAGRLVIWNYAEKDHFTLSDKINELNSVVVLNKNTVIAAEEDTLILFKRRGLSWTRSELGSHSSPIAGIEAANSHVFAAYTREGEVSHWDIGIWPPCVSIRNTGIEGLQKVTPINRNLFLLFDDKGTAFSLTIMDEGFWLQDPVVDKSTIPVFTDCLGSEITVRVGPGGKVSIISHADALNYETDEKQFSSDVLSARILNRQMIVAGCQDGSLELLQRTGVQNWAEREYKLYQDPVVNLSRFGPGKFLSLISTGHLEILSIPE